MEDVKKKMVIAVQAFFAAWALLRICNLTTTNLLGAFGFVLLCFAFWHITALREQKGGVKREKRVSIALSSLFTFFYLCGDFEHICVGLDNVLFRMVILLVTAIGLFVLFYYAVDLIFLMARGVRIDGEKEVLKHVGVFTFLLCLLCWLPYLLKNYPGIMTVDGMNQYAQVIGVYADSNHHPWVHTQLIKLFYTIGSLFTDNPSIAISFYTVFQMCFMAGCAAYVTATLSKYHVKKWILAAVIAFYALVPYNAIYAITIWKDTLFAGGVLLYTVTVFRLLQKDGDGKVCGLYVLSGLMMCLFRSNGWYAFLLMTPILLWVFRKNWKKMVLLQLGMIAVVLIIKGPVMNGFGVIQPDLIESMSIPVQQISRVIVLEKPITEEQTVFLNEILDTSKIKELYNPYVSDGFKRLVRAGNQEYLNEYLGEFLKVYAQIGLRYPQDYLLAFRDQSIGFWFPTQEGLLAADEGVIENEFGLTNLPVLKGPLIIKLNEIMLKLKDILPGYGLLWSMGAIFWVILLAMGLVYAKGDKKLLLLFVPCIAIFLTLVAATPVAREFRYAYAYILCLPLYATLPFLGKEE